MNIKLYFLILILTLSTFSIIGVSAIDSNYSQAPSSSINISDITFNNPDIVLIELKNTNSMLPTLDSNNIVLGIPMNNETKLNIGDIAIYNSSNTLVIHRIIDIKDNKYLLKGDNNNFNDLFIDIEDIKYKAVGVIY